jgi:hypothetical protein
VEFVAGNAVLAVANHPDRRHPLVQTDGGILENCADFDGELLLAAIAEPELPRLHKRVGLRAATGARNLVIGPAKELRVVKRAVMVGEVSYCLEKSYRLFHFSHLQSINRIALLDLCVKYIIARI